MRLRSTAALNRCRLFCRVRSAAMRFSCFLRLRSRSTRRSLVWRALQPWGLCAGRLFRCRLEATSSSLWMMSGILAMLKRDGFNPSTTGLFNTAIASVSASLAFSGVYGAVSASLAFSGVYGGVGVSVPSLYASGVSPDAFEGPDSGAAETLAHSHPGSVTGLFDEPLLNLVAAQAWLCLRLCPPAPVPSLWLRPRRLSPVHRATVRSGAAVGAELCVLLALWRPQVLQGWSGVGSFFETFGFLEVGAIALPNPVRWLSVPPLAGLEGQGRSSVGGGGPPGGVSHTLPPASASVYGTHPHAFVCSYFHRRGCTRGGHPAVDCQGCCGACSSSLSQLFQPPVSGLEDLGVVASGHRPVPAQSLRGHFPLSPGTHPVCSHVSPTGGSSGGVSSGSCASGISSLPALCGSWPHLPIHALCFGLSTATQVFPRVMAPVSVLHSLGIRMRRYRDDWFVQASSRVALLRDLGVVLSLCRELGIVVNPE